MNAGQEALALQVWPSVMQVEDLGLEVPLTRYAEQATAGLQPGLQRAPAV